MYDKMNFLLGGEILKNNREKLIQILSSYFDIGDSYVYHLTRDKSAFAVGTVSIDDFEEFDGDTISDIADYIIKHWSDTNA